MFNKGYKRNAKAPFCHSGRAKPNPRKTLEDYKYNARLVNQTPAFEVTTEFLINYIERNFDQGNEIAMAIESFEDPDQAQWKAKMNISSEKDPVVRAQETEQFKIWYQSNYKEYKLQVSTYKSNKTKAYALFMGRCFKAIESIIELRYDFTDKIKDNLIELLKGIQEHALNYQEHQYNMSIILDSMRNMLQTKQRIGESLQDNTKRFRTSRDVFETQLGGLLILTKIASEMPDYNQYNNAKILECQKKSFKSFSGNLYLDNEDKIKYGSLLNRLSMQQSLKNNQYQRLSLRLQTC
jgi:hypothetical protein